MDEAAYKMEYTRCRQAKMLLSQETIHGIKMTGMESYTIFDN